MQGALWHVGVVTIALVLTLLHIGATVAYVPLDRLATFEAFEPFQHRVLVPALVAAGRGVAPGVQPAALYAVVEVIFWMALLYVGEAAIRTFVAGLGLPARRLLAFTAAWPVAIHLIKPQSFELIRADGTLCRVEALDLNFARINLAPNLYYPYDLPAAVFTLLLVVLAMRYREHLRPGRLVWYLAVVAAAALNRESAVIVVLATAALLPTRPRAKYWTVLAAHVVLALAVSWLAREMIAASAQPNPHGGGAGGPYEFHLFNNIRTLLHPFYFVWIVPLFAGGLWVPLAAYRRLISRDLRRVICAFVLPSLALALVFGQVLEGRVFIEVQPLLWIAAIQAIAATLNRAAPATLEGQPGGVR